MAVVVRRRVISPFVAFHARGNDKPFVTVPLGSIIETAEEQIRSPGLVEIQLDDQRLLAFTRDINERAEPIALPSAAGMRERG